MDSDGLTTGLLIQKRSATESPRVAIVMDNMHSFQKYVCKLMAKTLKNDGVECMHFVLSDLDIECSKAGNGSRLNIIEHLSGGRISGIIALTSSVGSHLDANKFYQLISSIMSVPVVHLGSIDGCNDSVGLDNPGAMRELLEHITNEAQCRKLCFIRGFGQLSDSAQREKEFVRYLEDNNLPLDADFIIDGEFRESVTYNSVTTMLQSGKIPDAILAANDHMAVAAMRAVQAFGLSVPDDVLVAGFDDRSIATECSPVLTSVRVNLNEYSRQCAQTMLQRIQQANTCLPDQQRNLEPTTVKNSCRLIVRQSTVGRQTLNQEKSVQEINRILTDEEHKLKLESNGTLFRAFMDTLNNNTEAFEAVIDRLEAFSDKEFEEHNVLRELFSAIGELLNNVTQPREFSAGLLRLSNLNHKISTLVYDAKAKQMLISARDQQNYNTLQMAMLKCHDMNHLIKAVDSAFDMLSVNTAYLVLNDSPATETVISKQPPHTLVYARNEGRRLRVEPMAVPFRRLLPTKFGNQETVGNILFHRLTGYGADYGYILFDFSTLESTLTEKICACITTAINDIKQIELQKLAAEQLRSLNAELAHKTNYDSITGLPNRRQCLSELEQALYECRGNSQQFSLTQIRLNDLGRVTLQHGREHFDFLLRTLAMNLKEASATDCHVYHTETSEFTVIVQNVSAADTQARIKALLDILDQSYTLSGHAFSISYNAGTVMYPQHGFNTNELISNANSALDYVGQQPDERHLMYDPSYCRRGIDKWNLDKQMRQALENEEFGVYYQPRINTQTGLIESFEALIRWFGFDEQGNRVTVSTPDVFIPVAEETGFIAELGDYVLNKSCEQLRDWRAQQFNIRLSINLSALELEKDTCVDRVVSTLEKYKIDSQTIEIEVTESAAMGCIESSILKLAQLQEHGISVAIDDFGTDYSSLTYLKRLPANCLKVDRSFLRDITCSDGGESVDSAIVRAVVSLGHNLGLYIVAEGVETSEQLEFLGSLNVEQVQGFYFSPAVDADSATQLMRVANLPDSKIA